MFIAYLSKGRRAIQYLYRPIPSFSEAIQIQRDYSDRSSICLTESYALGGFNLYRKMLRVPSGATWRVTTIGYKLPPGGALTVKMNS